MNNRVMMDNTKLNTLRSHDLADDDLFICAECGCTLDIEESIRWGEYLICELCDEQLQASGLK